MSKEEQKPNGIQKKIKKTGDKKSPNKEENEQLLGQEIKELTVQDQQMQIELISNLEKEDKYKNVQEQLFEFDQGEQEDVQLIKLQAQLMNQGALVSEQNFIRVNFMKCYHRGFDQMKINEKYLTDQQKSLFEKQRKMFNYLSSNLHFSQYEINMIITYLKWGINDEQQIKKIYEQNKVRQKSYLYCYLSGNKLQAQAHPQKKILTDQQKKFNFWQTNNQMYYKTYCAGMSFNLCLLHQDKEENKKHCNNVTYFCTNEIGKKFVTWAKNEGSLRIPTFGNPQSKIIIFIWIVQCIKLYINNEDNNLTVYPTLDNIYELLVQMKDQKNLPSLFTGLDFDFLKETTTED